MSVRVSVILPTHNRAATLPRAVESVLAQDFGDFELIVVDDASTDSSVEYLAGLQDPRVRVLRKPQREGAARARNDGIRAARADWVAFQDSDDVWLPQKLALQSSLAAKVGSNVGWIGGGYRNGDQVVSSMALALGVAYDGELLVGAPFVTPTWFVWRKHLVDLGGFDAQMPCLEDWDLVFRLADVCAFRAVPDVVMERHASTDSLYGDTAKRRAGLEVILTRHRARWLKEPARYARWCTELGRLHALHGDPAASRRWLGEALRHDPLQLRAAGLGLAGVINSRLQRRLSRTRLAEVRP